MLRLIIMRSLIMRSELGVTTRRTTGSAYRMVREHSSSSSSSSSSGRSGHHHPANASPTADHDSRESDTISTSKLPRRYTTRESVEEALRRDPRYSSLQASSGWLILPLLRLNPSGVVLQKSFPPRQPFESWDAVLEWLHSHLRPITHELDVSLI
jgi:hypothetical protein